MILIGDKLVPYTETFFIESIDEIKNSKANSTLIYKSNYDLLKYCYQNSLSSGVVVETIKDAIYANSLKATFIICNTNLAIDIQKLAEHYMFDSKVLTIIDSEDKIESVALNGIDGAIYERLLSK